MIDKDSDDFDGHMDDAGNGKGIVTTRNDAGEVLCVTEVINLPRSFWVGCVGKELEFDHRVSAMCSAFTMEMFPRARSENFDSEG